MNGRFTQNAADRRQPPPKPTIDPLFHEALATVALLKTATPDHSVKRSRAGSAPIDPICRETIRTCKICTKRMFCSGIMRYTAMANMRSSENKLAGRTEPVGAEGLHDG